MPKKATVLTRLLLFIVTRVNSDMALAHNATANKAYFAILNAKICRVALS